MIKKTYQKKAKLPQNPKKRKKEEKNNTNNYKRR